MMWKFRIVMQKKRAIFATSHLSVTVLNTSPFLEDWALYKFIFNDLSPGSCPRLFKGRGKDLMGPFMFFWDCMYIQVWYMWKFMPSYCTYFWIYVCCQVITLWRKRKQINHFQISSGKIKKGHNGIRHLTSKKNEREKSIITKAPKDKLKYESYYIPLRFGLVFFIGQWAFS